MKIEDLSKVLPISKPVEDIPILDVTDLPSKFLPYAGSRISYRPFTYGEMVKFNNSNLSSLERYNLIMSGITTEGFKKEQLAYFDYLFLTTLRKISTTSNSQFNIKYTCNECGHFNDQDRDLSTILFADLEIPAFPLFIPLNEDGTDVLEVGVLTAKSYFDLLSKNKLDDPIAVYASTVLNKKYDEAYKIISNARNETLELLEEVDQLINFRVNTTKVICSKCGNSEEKELGEIQNLIFPFRRDTVSIRNRIRFGIPLQN
jgi:hypothetical protein